MAKFCSNCGKELDENAALCLNCGVIVENTQNNSNNVNKTKMCKKKGLPTWVIVLIVIGCVMLIPLIFIILICLFVYYVVNGFDYSTEETLTQNGTIGDVLTTDEFNITLHDALIYSSIGTDENNLDIPDEGKEYLVFFFEVENVSNDNEYISDYDFTGYADGYEVEIAYLYNDIEGIKELDANLPPNKRTKGYVAFEVDTTWQEFEIRHEDWFGSNELVFAVVNEEISSIADP